MGLSQDSQSAAVHQALLPGIVVEPLASRLNADDATTHHVIIEIRTDFVGYGSFVSGGFGARSCAIALVKHVDTDNQALRRDRLITMPLYPYVFAELTSRQIYDVLLADGGQARDLDACDAQGDPHMAVAHRHQRAIFKIWESAPVAPLANVSIRTVKADASQKAFAASGKGIVWAVLDSGIDATHPHFQAHNNLTLKMPLQHKSFIAAVGSTAADPLRDDLGHGTHVAGIIAGANDISNPLKFEHATAAVQSVDMTGTTSEYHFSDVSGICGMAPQCTLLSMQVLDASGGGGDTTAVIQALEQIMQWNTYGDNILVHGANISIGYPPNPLAYGVGQSPLCRQVDRAVGTGLVVVVAAGNFGFIPIQSIQAQEHGNIAFASSAAGQFMSIADPANAPLAIAVGSTHREKPKTFGVSFFSSRGPTVDGRLKPDVVAPGEKIISCAAGLTKQKAASGLPPALQLDPTATFDYAEESGTSMAAPHVSGIIAAYLSVRTDLVGEPEKIRDLLCASAVDLGRDQRLQGSGLVDLFRMLQA